MSARELITDHLDLWTGAVMKKSGSGRGSNGKTELTGVKKLRELILQLAVEGNLVQQDSSHKPASELLQAAADEKAQALKDKKIRKSQLGDPASIISESDVPEGWAFTTLSAIGYWAIGNGFPKAHQGETGLEVLFCKVSDMNLPENSREIHTTVNSVSEQTAHSLKLNIHSSGTVIFPKIGGAISTNKRRVIIKRTAIDNNCLGITPTCAISSGYLYLFLTSVDMTQYQVGTSVPALSQGTLGKIPVKLPPLEEQHRIVQKVDELMALCDRLEQQTSDQLEAHETLVDTLLGSLFKPAEGSLTPSENATELADNWARLAAHFDTLFTTEQSIDKLKQTILQLAVMGRLVEQDAGDEPVGNLRQRIAMTKTQLIETGALRKQRPSPALEQAKVPFTAPGTWEWVTFGEITFNRDAERIPLSVDDRRKRSGEFDYYGASGVIDSIDDYLFDCPLLLIGEDGANLINRATPIAFIARGKYWVNNHAHVIDGISEDFLRYLCLYINAISLEPYVTGTAQPKMNQAKMNSIPVPLPPENEQVRIVQKVDELMALCDRLKERLNQASETRNQLAEAVVEGALN